MISVYDTSTLGILKVWLKGNRIQLIETGYARSNHQIILSSIYLKHVVSLVRMSNLNDAQNYSKNL